MLQGTTSADTKVPAGKCLAIRTCNPDRCKSDQISPSVLPLLNLDDLAWKRKGQKGSSPVRQVGDAVAFGSETIDAERDGTVSRRRIQDSTLSRATASPAGEVLGRTGSIMKAGMSSPNPRTEGPRSSNRRRGSNRRSAGRSLVHGPPRAGRKFSDMSLACDVAGRGALSSSTMGGD